MKQLLIPHPIAEKITLYEAMLYIGFNIYFPETYTANCEKTREDFSYQEDFTISCDGEQIDTFFTEEVCNKYNLPKSYLAEFIIENNGYPTRSFNSWESINDYKNNKNYPEEYINQLIEEKKESDSLEAKQLPFEEALNDYLEIIKSKLFIELRTGNIIAYGREILSSFSKKILNENKEDEYVDLSSLKTEELYFGYEGKPVFEVIPKEEWRHEGLDWNNECIRSDKKCYCHILVDTASLYQCYPEKESQDTKVHAVNGMFVIDKNDSVKVSSIKGRKPLYNWQEFNAEMAKRLVKGKLPDMQKSCVIDMQDWCKEKWGVVPSDTNLKNYISPFYQAKNESEIKSES